MDIGIHRSPSPRRLAPTSSRLISPSPALKQFWKISVISVGASVVRHRMPLKTFVSVPVVLAAHQSMHEVELSPLARFNVFRVTSEGVSW